MWNTVRLEIREISTAGENRFTRGTIFSHEPRFRGWNHTKCFDH